MASQSEENYLKALFHLSSERGEVNVSELSANLGVSKPSANSMVKNLQQQGLVNYQKYKPLTLTDKGRKGGCPRRSEAQVDGNVPGGQDGFWMGGST